MDLGLELLDHPIPLVIALVLSLVGSGFLGKGFRQRNVPHLLLGIGLNIPAISLTDWRFWFAGACIVAVGWRMSVK